MKTLFLIAGLSLTTIFSALLEYSTVPTPVDAPDSPTTAPEVVKFRIDPSKSSFMVNADRSGILYFKGHSHRIAVRDFDGEVTLALDALNPASLVLNIRAASLEETSDVFTAAQKGIINKELNDLVLETAKYPTISFKSSEVTGKVNNGHFEITVGGDITLHGVTRHIKIPASVTADGSMLRARGQFSLDRTKFKVNATSAFHGTVRIRRMLKFTFDIVGQRV